MPARKSTKKKKAATENDVWDQDEEGVFAAFGVGEGDLALRRFIRGQRKINGRFYKNIETIIKHLQGQSKGSTPELTSANDLNEGVPGPPPGCDDK